MLHETDQQQQHIRCTEFAAAIPDVTLQGCKKAFIPFYLHRKYINILNNLLNP
jgi:hypothetical protein